MHAAVPLDGGGRQVSFLPSAHIADRWASHYSALMTYGEHAHAGPGRDAGSWPSSPRSARRCSAASRGSGRSSAPRSRRRPPPQLAGARGPTRRSARRSGPARPRRRAVAVLRRGADAGRGARVLRRARAADLRGLGHDRDVVHRHDEPPGPDAARHGRDSRSPGMELPDRRRRRAARPRPARHARLPRPRRPDRARRSTRTAGCTPATSRGSTTTATSGSSTARRS